MVRCDVEEVGLVAHCRRVEFRVSARTRQSLVDGRNGRGRKRNGVWRWPVRTGLYCCLSFDTRRGGGMILVLVLRRFGSHGEARRWPLALG